MNQEHPTLFNSVVDKLLVAISPLPEDDIRTLIDLFAQPAASKLLSALLQQQLELKRLERQLKAKTPLPTVANDTVLVKEEKASPTKASPKVSPQTSLKSSPKKEAPTSIQEYTQKLRSKNDWENGFQKVLMDRHLFATTRDVVDAVNKACGLEADYENFRKSGRERLIRHYQRQLMELSVKEQQGVATKLSDWLLRNQS